MTVTYHPALVQGSDEWRSARCGLLTASEMHLLVTPTLKSASNDKERGHLYEIISQRITRYVEPSFISDDMLRGWTDEVEARNLYSERYAPVEETGFITNDRWGFTIGYSPDGLVGNDGLIECKSRRQRYQIRTLLLHYPLGVIPSEHVIQVQTGLLVSERKWCDYVSYCGGLPMCVIRVRPDERVQQAIVAAAEQFEEQVQAMMAQYAALCLIPTERRVEGEILL